MQPLILSLLLVAVAWQPLEGYHAPATHDRYTVVRRMDEGDAVVAVVRRNELLYLLYDETVIGAEFDHPTVRDQTVFPGFAIMQCAAYLQDKPTRAVQIGLGIGSVPTFLRAMAIPTDVVEISRAVVTQATDYFHGRTFVMDGLKFVSSTPSQIIGGTTHERPYDLFIVDVYTGWNPFAFFVREKMLQVRENWLTLNGVLVMNFVGYVHGPHAVVPKSIYRTLQSVFKYVKCYREMEEVDERDASNLVFYASDKPFSFNLPTTERYQDAPDHTYFSVVKNFPKWEIFAELQDQVEVAVHQEMEEEEVRFVASNKDELPHTRDTAAPRVLTELDHGQEDFREIHTDTETGMRKRVLEQFPPALWEELKQKSATTTTK
ncbi:unnamed protein product [Hyaloperonospora brassicae]|uniref:PABS domain-containing protein n=1 Tax=Hyaloperonospora brassicae TaxID=162125 RepID=A0AAV0UC09_HYABA|nr:unnamed protein product [Hyaloperonospora brassicae]